MKKQQRKLRFIKSKIAHFRTAQLFGGTNGTTNPYSNITINESDCQATIMMSCHDTGCTTHGRPRTNEDSPCGNTTDDGLYSNNDCIMETVNTNC